MNRAKWLVLSASIASGALLFGNGCLSAFWQGWNTGATDSRWLNLAIDVANEAVFG